MSGRPGWGPRVESPPFDRAGHPAAIATRLVRAWQRLCEDERDSVIAATLAATDLARLGAPAHIMGAAARVIEDEVRHVEVCAQVLERLGATPCERPIAARRATLGDDMPVATRCARILLAGFAVSEPMSAACFAAARRRATEPLIRWALTELLRDEARHGPFGIAAGGWVVTTWSSAERRALWPACVHEMESFERALGGPIPAGADRTAAGAMETPGAASIAVGLLRPSDNCAAAIACIPRWILPPLARLEIAPVSLGAGP